MKLESLLNLLFGCHHSNLSRVFTIRRRTYLVCCDCGAEFEYSLEAMTKRQRLHVSKLHVVKDAGHVPA
jgi:hypothetical protein